MRENELQIIQRKTKEPPDESGPVPRLQGEKKWLLSGSSESMDAITQELGSIAERLSDELIELDFGNAVGFFDLPFYGRIEVTSGKWDQSNFEQMLADITRVAAALPFASGSPTSLPYDRSLNKRLDVLYHLFVYLRHILSDDAPRHVQLMPSLRSILADPHRRFDRVRKQVRLELARRVDHGTLERLVMSADLLRLKSPVARSGPLAGRLGGRLPESIQEPTVEVSFDTAENRFVKTFLDLVLAETLRMQEVFACDRRVAFRQRGLRECDEMIRKIRPVRQNALWRTVGQMVQLPAGSTVLQGRRGYREVFQHFVRMRLSTFLPISEDEAFDLLESKDIALLYELWCFFTLAEEITRLLGPARSAGRPKASPKELYVKHSLEIRWDRGYRLRYNQHFGRRPRWASYSVGLRPDISLLVPVADGEELHLLDAKFKLRNLKVLEGDVDEVEDQERRGDVKRGDLYKMHAYRDAIPTAKSVWVLYPGTEARFFGTDGTRTSDLAELPEGPCDGVGAAPFVPLQRDRAELRCVLGALLRN